MPYDVKHIVNTDSGNGLAPIRRQAIIMVNADLQSICPSETNFSEIPIKIPTFSIKINVLEKDICENGGRFVQPSMC